MDVTHEISYPGASLDDVVTMIFDPAFRAAVCEATHAISHQVDIRVEDDGSALVTVSRTLPAEVPDIVKRFVGETIQLTQTERWAAGGGTGPRHADLRLEVVGQPATMIGSILLEATPGGVHELITGQLKVSVPFVGGKIETEIAKGIVAAARVEQTTGRAWLAG